ncbi:hypothetical protein KSF_105040 [Reticulibacter mediterranei]|uniref:HTH marR-type domain-containing protein n=1 Tax=Reticulibacter mediterranei TaxID=2778369 RepID=A0A8J3J2Q1_9CHLR|nr:MarR family transcriptional regulator [Reticulibacter mediterranei]GHP00457.1 hypothetical protein KSF_105040 [Reticulibacter mediterranei]
MDNAQSRDDSKTDELAGRLTKKKSFPLLTILYETARQADAALQGVLAPVNLSTAQWSILHVIDEHPGIAGATIARQGKISPAAVTTMLQRLEATGLIERHAPSHGRAMETFLTSYGRECLQAGDAAVRHVEQLLWSLADERDLIQLLTIMELFITTLDALEKNNAEERGE